MKAILEKHGIPPEESEGAIRWMLRHPISLNLVPFYYILGGPEMHDVVPIQDMDEWMAWMVEHKRNGDCRVALWNGSDPEGDPVSVSTVFIGYDIHVKSPPRSCFETLVIADDRVPMAGWEWRAGSWDGALENHHLVVAGYESWYETEMERRNGGE